MLGLFSRARERERVLKGVWCTFITRDEGYMSNAYDRVEIHPFLSAPLYFSTLCIQRKQLKRWIELMQ
jgi:hypothetical protein